MILQAAAKVAAQKSKPEPVVKLPIPADHQVLQDIFDGLTKQCLSASANPVSYPACHLYKSSYSH